MANKANSENLAPKTVGKPTTPVKAANNGNAKAPVVRSPRGQIGLGLARCG